MPKVNQARTNKDARRPCPFCTERGYDVCWKCKKCGDVVCGDCIYYELGKDLCPDCSDPAAEEARWKVWFSEFDALLSAAGLVDSQDKFLIFASEKLYNRGLSPSESIQELGGNVPKVNHARMGVPTEDPRPTHRVKRASHQWVDVVGEELPEGALYVPTLGMGFPSGEWFRLDHQPKK